MEDEQQRIINLRRMQRLATGLLVAAGVLFVLTSIFRDVAPWVPFVRAFAEAAMVGAFADWFAVTALFRHPLGIPIPHTAIIPNRKSQIAVGFGRFIEHNFLDPDQITTRIRSQNLVKRLAKWLRSPERANQIADAVTEIIRGILNVIDDDEVSRALSRGLNQRLETIRAAPLVGRFLGILLAGDRQRDALVQLINLLAEVIATNENEIRRRIARELPPWVPRIVDRRIYERLLEGVQRLLDELRGNPDHPVYHQFAGLIDRWIVDLQFDPQMQQQINGLKHELINHPVAQELVRMSWRDLKLTLLEQSVTSSSSLHRSIVVAVERFADVIEDNNEWYEKIENWMTAVVVALVSRYRHVIGEFVTQVVNSWDTQMTTRKIELQFGRDLQFIRINGTIVGGLVGLIIHSVSLLFT
ncbi:DUF445 domain-containing protein [Chloroflexus sp. MS-CIW-1]|uniref:DUF445 domain-containing protein n=1 Tax=Chloroflexus sp. MS-CIW-1 TaxID=3055768 RepID=UPI0026497C77|nr:DUF445 domain-containing protein [Chloroflexus sp. MS-CIW-1]MDN5271716.1 DUF445 domain-containing protein [Chloroflexus sp. MS-CIW-1]